jgi:hypothetical protein
MEPFSLARQPIDPFLILILCVSGLDFTSQSLKRNFNQPTEELSTSFRAAYADTLQKHHSFLVKPVFNAAMGATPYRKDFYAKIGGDDAKTKEELGRWLDALDNVCGILKDFLASPEISAKVK